MLMQIKEKLKFFSSISRELFIFALIFYLTLLILENILPGFVSNNLNLNLLLLLVILLGVASSFAPEKETEKVEIKASKTDYLTIILAGIASGALIFNSIQLTIVPKAILSAIVFGLIVFILRLFIITKDEIEEDVVSKKELTEKKDEISKVFNFLSLVKKANNPWTHANLSNPQKVRSYKKWIFFIILTALLVFLYRSLFSFKTNTKNESKPETAISKTLKENPVLSEGPKLPPRISVKFLNGNGLEGEGIKMDNLATSSGFLTLEASNAAYYKYPKTIIFYKTKKEDADKVATIVAQRYPKYDILEATQSYEADVTVILGKR